MIIKYFMQNTTGMSTTAYWARKDLLWRVGLRQTFTNAKRVLIVNYLHLGKSFQPALKTALAGMHGAIDFQQLRTIALKQERANRIADRRKEDAAAAINMAAAAGNQQYGQAGSQFDAYPVADVNAGFQKGLMAGVNMAAGFKNGGGLNGGQYVKKPNGKYHGTCAFCHVWGHHINDCRKKKAKDKKDAANAAAGYKKKGGGKNKEKGAGYKGQGHGAEKGGFKGQGHGKDKGQGKGQKGVNKGMVNAIAAAVAAAFAEK
jgi:hypothetical protein